MKVCPKCKIEKPFNEFHKKTANKDGFDSRCKSCTAEMVKRRSKKLASRTHIEIPKTKKCSKCKIEKSFNEFNQCKSKKDGLQSLCKSCKAEEDKRYGEKLKGRTNIEIPKTKKCTKCKLEKTSDEFSKDKRSKNGLSSKCKSCVKEWTKEYRKKLASRTTIKIPKTKMCHTCKIEKPFGEFNKSKHTVSGLSSSCKKCKAEYNKSEKAKKLANKRHKNRYKNDEIYRLRKILRRFLGRSIKLAKKSSNEDIKKSKKSLEYVGCTIEELKNHLEKQFYPHPETGEEMTWENHAFEGWHVDHIKPLSSFDLTSEKEIMKANHYTNLQPLWAEENLSKNNRYEE